MKQKIWSVMRVALPAVLTLTLLLGILLFAFGLYEQHTIRAAKATCTAVRVQVTDVQPTGSWLGIAVVLEETQGQPPFLGRTAATTVNDKLSVGDTLTMYYDPASPDVRVVDFKTAAPLLGTGTAIGGVSLAALAVFCGAALRRRRVQPATQVAE